MVWIVQIPAPPPFDSRAQRAKPNGALSEARRAESKGFSWLQSLAHAGPERRSCFVYILQCSDKSLYVGSTHNVEIRVAEHNAGRGGIYTSRRLPVSLVYSEVHGSESAAVKRERQIKRWTAAKKVALIDGCFERLHQLARRRKR